MENIKEKLTPLRNERTHLRRFFTAAANKLEASLKSQDQIDVVIDFYNRFVDKALRLFKVDGEIGELLHSVETSDNVEIDKEFDTMEDYRDTYTSLIAKKERFVSILEEDNKTVISSHSSGSGLAMKCKLTLPKLIPKQFSGKIKDWISFWAIFRRIHESTDFDDEMKFQYLLLYTAENSPARDLVESFPPSAGNYPKAIEQLKARFGRDDLLIELYVRELLSLVLVKARGENFDSLRSLYDNLTTQLRALETLGVAGDKCTYLLTPLVESALPNDVLKDWERENSTSKCSSVASEVGSVRNVNVGQEVGVSDDKMQRLLAFLRREVESEERLSLARTSFTSVKDKQSTLKPVKSSNGSSTPSPQSKVVTAADLVNVKNNSSKNECIFCNNDNHSSENCFTARECSLEHNQKLVKERGGCFQCLRRGHNRRTCRSGVKCIICDGKHVPLMCPSRGVTSDKNSQVESTVENSLSNISQTSVVMQTVMVRLKTAPNVTARVLFDSGSQRSYVTKRLASVLNSPPTGEVHIEHALFGGTVSAPKRHHCYKLRIESMSGKYSCNFEVLDTEVICQAVPVVPVASLLCDLKQKNVTLTDVQGGPIDILIGADIGGRLLTGTRVELDCGLVAFYTHLGWTLMGKIPDMSTSHKTLQSHLSLFSADFSISDLWRLDTIGIEDSAQVKSREDRATAAKDHFNETVTILENGRYQVNLPWLDDHPPLPRNFGLASKRLDCTLRRLRNSSNEQRYFEVLMDWCELGIIEEVPSGEWDIGHYLPHRPVYKEGSTTPVRPVFDASAHEKGKPSLNHCLETGPNLIEIIPSVLLRFRRGRIGLIADVKKAFLQISIHPSDRDFLRFIWKDANDQLRIFRHTRVVFGVCCSPFLLGAVLDHHLDLCQEAIERREIPVSSNAIEQVRRCLYVDNYVGSHSNMDEVRIFMDQASMLFSMAQFELRGWEYSGDQPEGPGCTPVLGLIWEKDSDVLKINIPDLSGLDFSVVTRRVLLSSAQKLFDPIGLTCPVTVIPKRLIQKAWISGGDWDTPVDDESKAEFLQWVNEIPLLDLISIPRWLIGMDTGEAVFTLHTFCDASQVAYASVVYLRIEYLGSVTVQIVAAKSRVTPVKVVTIPRLELLAATVGARLCHNVKKVLDISDTHYWSDSSTVLSWIQREEPWGVFVGNRVKEIRSLSKPEEWFHVPGTSNPADLASRGCLPRNLVNSHWWEGPSWLKLPKCEWPNVSFETDEKEVLEERRKSLIVSCFDGPTFSQLLTERVSCYWKLLKIVGWMVRFRNNACKNSTRIRGRLTLHELEVAERWILRLVQYEAFSETNAINVKRLKPRKSEDGVLHVRTKIWARKDSEDFRSPIILPQHHVVDKLIYHYHCKSGHIVGQHLLNTLRERFWVVKGRRTVKRITNNCVVCRRFTAQNLDVKSPPLPEERVRDAKVFEVSGTDYAGPLYLADGTKVWVCLFTCAIYRAVHLDLVSSLSTEAFMLAFRRFVARRGRPSVMYSDNGTNFRGMVNAISQIDWEKVAEYGQVDKIEWRFNPPTAAWWGGFWERMVRTLKSLLRKNLGRASLNYEELYTAICDAEALINSRPITYVSECVDDPVAITPQMFLQEIREAGLPECDVVESSSLARRLQHRQRVQEELRQRFRVEYLGQLTLSGTKLKNTREPVIGEIVLIGSDGTKRLDWPLGVVEEIIRGKDNRIRVVQVKTAEGRLCRPVQRLHPLEIFSSIEDDDPKTDHGEDGALHESSDSDIESITNSIHPIQSPKKDHRTRCGRSVKLPVRFQ